MTDTANLPAELEAFARDAESRAEHGIAPVATYAAMFRKAAAALTSREAGEGECRGCEGTKRVMDIGADGKGEWVACPECAAPPPVAGEPELRCTDPDNCRRCSEDADSPHAGLPRATPAPPPPVDGKWVPLVPTPEMIERGVRGAAWHGNPIEASQRECARIYAAMLAAAPATPAATAVTFTERFAGVLDNARRFLAVRDDLYKTMDALAELTPEKHAAWHTVYGRMNWAFIVIGNILHHIERGAPTPTPADAGAVVTAARALVSKLQLIHADPRYLDVWILANNRGTPYSGPRYDTELAALTAALSAQPEARQGEVCGNCDTALPKGCGGLFTDDATCALRKDTPYA